ncbi:hypothetical protein, partial [Gemmatimonas sp.]|uniref:hypothetical protein n=1 Tax=Gemmatimonas sp. TaxID=1962908 RepID=UPI003983007F
QIAYLAAALKKPQVTDTVLHIHRSRTSIVKQRSYFPAIMSQPLAAASVTMFCFAAFSAADRINKPQSGARQGVRLSFLRVRGAFVIITKSARLATQSDPAHPINDRACRASHRYPC